MHDWVMASSLMVTMLKYSQHSHLFLLLLSQEPVVQMSKNNTKGPKYAI
jgi:hypothetical protein